MKDGDGNIASGEAVSRFNVRDDAGRAGARSWKQQLTALLLRQKKRPTALCAHVNAQPRAPKSHSDDSDMQHGVPGKASKNLCAHTKHNHGPKTHKLRQSRKKGIDSNDSQKSAMGPRKANAMTASSVSSS